MKVPLASINVVDSSAYLQVAHWKKTYGSTFTLVWRSAEFPVKLYKYAGEWRIQYNQSKQYSPYVPFALEIAPHDPNIIHIHNIHKTRRHTGSQLVRFVIALCKKLGANEAILQDAAFVTCRKNKQEMRLSVIQLLKDGQGFYERFGFEITNTKQHARLMDKIKKLQKIKISSVLAKFQEAIQLLVQAKKDPTNFELKIISTDGYPDIYMRNPNAKISELLPLFRQIARKLTRSNSTFLTDFLVYSAKHKTDCAVYTEFLDLAFQNHSLVYKNKQVNVNKWARTIVKIERSYPDMLRYKF